MRPAFQDRVAAHRGLALGIGAERAEIVMRFLELRRDGSIRAVYLLDGRLRILEHGNLCPTSVGWLNAAGVLLSFQNQLRFRAVSLWLQSVRWEPGAMSNRPVPAFSMIAKPQILILEQLSEGPKTLKELARFLNLDRGECSRVLSSLVEHDVVEQEDNVYRKAEKDARPRLKRRAARAA